jgi:hypothetical protein
MAEVEKFEQVANCWTIDGCVRVVPAGNGVGEVVSAAPGDGIHIPVPLNKFENGNVI